jgi:methyl-accepting chemotaxis protein
MLQVLLIIVAVMFSRSRRFARPLPVVEPSRISKLEYVSAMAELKRRTNAFDLAVENIYTDFRRRVSRLTGIDNSSEERSDTAREIAARTTYSAAEIEQLMTDCEDIVHGVPTSKKEVLALAKKIREIERALGLRRGRLTMRK